MKNSTRRALAYVYYEEEPGRRAAANLLLLQFEGVLNRTPAVTKKANDYCRKPSRF